MFTVKNSSGILQITENWRSSIAKWSSKILPSEIRWGKCKGFYVCEKECSLKTHFLEHKRPSSTCPEVSNHIHIKSPGPYIDLYEVQILDREPSWFERGVKEAIYIKVYKPLLKTTGVATNFQKSTNRSRIPKVTTWYRIAVAERLYELLPLAGGNSKEKDKEKLNIMRKQEE